MTTLLCQSLDCFTWWLRPWSEAGRTSWDESSTTALRRVTRPRLLKNPIFSSTDKLGNMSARRVDALTAAHAWDQRQFQPILVWTSNKHERERHRAREGTEPVRGKKCFKPYFGKNHRHLSARSSCQDGCRVARLPLKDSVWTLFGFFCDRIIIWQQLWVLCSCCQSNVIKPRPHSPD